MNRFENWFCDSRFWRGVTRKHVLPWLLADADLGNHVLELGSGPGAATEELRKRAARVTSLEYSHAYAANLVSHSSNTNGAVLQGDASSLPFPENTFSSAIAILVLHHLRSNEAQERAFTEVARVLRPGGIFLAIEIQDSWLNRISHFRSTFTPVNPTSVSDRLASIGFSSALLKFRRGVWALHAVR